MTPCEMFRTTKGFHSRRLWVRHTDQESSARCMLHEGTWRANKCSCSHPWEHRPSAPFLPRPDDHTRTPCATIGTTSKNRPDDTSGHLPHPRKAIKINTRDEGRELGRWIEYVSPFAKRFSAVGSPVSMEIRRTAYPPQKLTMRHSPISSVAHVVPVTRSDKQFRKDRPFVYSSCGWRLSVSHDVTTVFSK